MGFREIVVLVLKKAGDEICVLARERFWSRRAAIAPSLATLFKQEKKPVN
jgi:hypothetical protein